MLNPLLDPQVETPENSPHKPGDSLNSLSELERAAYQLAKQHQATTLASFPPYLRQRLTTQTELLQAIHRYFISASQEELAYSAVAEWILDNYYVVQQTVRQVKQDLPAPFYEQLPKLAVAEMATPTYHGYPRVYAIAHQYLLTEQCHTDMERLERFLHAYQQRTPLTMGEVWAIPIMLRICLLECLAQTVGRTIRLFADENVPAELHFTLEVAEKDAVANCVLSLRQLDSYDWQSFFEAVNLVERTLRQDPAQIYGRMTFTTRDQYRKIIENLALAVGKDETMVAETAVHLAQSAHPNAVFALDGHEWAGLHLPPACHVGYYLLGPARHTLEEEIGCQLTAGLRGRHGLWRHNTAVYSGSITLLTLLLLAVLLAYAASAEGSWPQLLWVAGLSFVPVTAVAVGLVNLAATLLTKPRVLPKLDFSEGVPASCRTLVVIPAIFTRSAEIRALLGELEQHYLRNPDPNLGFALLTDFADAPQPAMPDDDALLRQAKAGIRTLNDRYPGRPFYLFHRRRLYNPSEGVWMGWERKRGKLQELNQLLRGANDTSYMVQFGDLAPLPQVKYVITLDADTVLPADAAQRLIGTLAHPLNQPHCEPHTRRITAGYSILQPRTEIQPASAGQSLFTRVFAGDVGLDLYSTAVSDVYQDLFGEGVFVGKGIYDVDAFECSLAHRIPENSLLSHDLFEGVQGRAGLVTDIVLYEDFPPNYLVHVRRTHRWIRGDWQLLPWLFPQVPTEGDRQRNDLPFLARWKIADNLRRSLVAPFLFLFFIAGWLWLPGSPAVWTLIGLLLLAFSLLTAVAHALARGIGGASWRDAGRPIRDSAVRWLLQIAFLPYEALLHLDAILITLWRLFVSRRQLLQWTTAAHTARLFGPEMSVDKTVNEMIRSLVVVAALLLTIVIWRPDALVTAVPLLLLWVLAAEVAHWISVPQTRETAVLSEAERQQLHSLARRTWLFFEEFVGPEDNWLPPDHYQEFPRGVVAHRTSPTNTGLYLLSALAAYDLGYISLLNLSLRLNATFETLDRLDRYRGHFLNWIDTRTLTPLPPRYVSTVDSGNLAGCLLALKQGCLSMREQPVWRPERWQGLLDTISLFDEAVVAWEKEEFAHPQPNGQEDVPIFSASVGEYLAQMQAHVLAHRQQPSQWATLITQLMETDEPELSRRLLALFESESHTFTPETIQQWRLFVEQLRRNLHGMERELALLSPWLLAFQRPPAYFLDADTPVAVQEAWQALQEALPFTPRLRELSQVCRQGEAALLQLQTVLGAVLGGESAFVTAARQWCADLADQLTNARLTAEPLLTSYELLAQRAHQLVEEMDFTFLYQSQRQVFHIGYNLENGRLDANYYDLLASEARIGSLVAIAKRDVPQKHWLHLARPLAKLRGGLALLSWSGTMFEYLMPPLLMNSYRGTLLAQSVQAVVAHQIAYGREHNVPWGISESGFYTFDNALNYQYRAFGVPGAGFKRGLSEDLVIAPYASMMAISVQPKAVLANLERLRQYQMMGLYGLYEALDFTASRLALGQQAAIVQSYMSHHQGMIMLALANYLQADKMVARFHAEPAIRSVELLLQEQAPSAAVLQNPNEDEAAPGIRPAASGIMADPWPIPTETQMPLVHFLSNGRLNTLITNAGGGYLAAPDLAYTRWRPDTTLDDWGLWLYVQDLESEQLWSATPQPTRARPQSQEVHFFPHMAQFRRRDHDITLQLEITIAPEEDVEIRHVHLANDSNRPRHLRLTSYGEVVLADFASDNRHPAFGKLFVESEYLPEENMLLFRRRPRAATESPRYLAHMLVTPTDLPPSRVYESDRAQFLGRNQTAARPEALWHSEKWLSGSTGSTLDPIMALGQELELEAHTAVELAWITLTADSREELLSLAQKYRRWPIIRRAFAGTQAQAEQDLRRLKLTVPELAQVQQLLSLLWYPHTAGRAEATTLAANTQGQPGLWAYGISGDYPILLLRLEEETGGDLLPAAIRAHTYWRRRGLRVDLVILNQQETNYGQPVQNLIYRTVQRLESDHWLNKRGGIFILRGDQMSQADNILLHTAARAILDASAGSLTDQLARLHEQPPFVPEFLPTLSPDEITETVAPVSRPTNLLFDNGWGGFTADGKQYAIYLEPGQATPAPWINVIANERLGFLVSEAGGGNTWAGNSGENRLTTWHNDPVTDAPAEALYLRDEETAEIWTPTPQPAPADAPYLVRHGAGYTTFEHHSHRLKHQLRLFVDPDSPVKIVQLRLENMSERPRRLTATYFAEWVLGTTRAVSQPYIQPTYHPEQGALLARNPYNAEFGTAVAFLAASQKPHGFTADRTEFLGRLGTWQRPAALERIGLSDRAQVGTDPAAVIQLHLDLPPGGSEEIYFLLGQGQNEAEALAIIDRFQNRENVTAAWDAVQTLWDEILGTITVETPDPAMNLLLNRWLLYQALACRLWGRSALYQSSGAYGFRDQLQDVMSLVYARPDLARAHLLRAARHQFEAGDVLHWWHPPSGRGVRTRMSDDLVWLPYVTAFYVGATGDTAVLDETIPFLSGPPLAEGEEERYGHYPATEDAHSLYEHCCRALAHAATQGRHGLPLMGTGDWNDGMNRVGREGEGESVWLGWFLGATLRAFATICEQRGDEQRANLFRQGTAAYRAALESAGWDGGWYRRAYYDDGTPLGSQQNDECQIDAIAQSWAVLSGLGNPDRAKLAMTAVEEQLIKPEERLILLFTPPFDKTRKDPGYVKGYVPGIRENGGQYTHAALWTIWALAELGEGEKAEALFRLINPIYHADTPEKAAHYKVEPYVIAADVYGVPPHEGRGGWTWYTGSSGWMYRLGVEGILGLSRQGETLRLRPQIPTAWPGFKLTYRYGRTHYHITVTNKPGSETQVVLDGNVLPGGEIQLVDDGRVHEILISNNPQPENV